MLAGSVYLFIKDELEKYNGNYLEIGIWDGSGISFLAEKYPGRTLYAIDPFIDDGNTTHVSGVEKGGELTRIREIALKSISNFENIILHEIKSEDFKHDGNLNVSFVFIDGDHSLEACVNDYKLAMSLIGKKAGAVVFDDVQTDGVGRAVQLFEKNYPHRISGKSTVRDATTIYYKIKAV